MSKSKIAITFQPERPIEDLINIQWDNDKGERQSAGIRKDDNQLTFYGDATKAAQLFFGAVSDYFTTSDGHCSWCGSKIKKEKQWPIHSRTT